MISIIMLIASSIALILNLLEFNDEVVDLFDAIFHFFLLLYFLFQIKREKSKE